MNEANCRLRRRLWPDRILPAIEKFLLKSKMQKNVVKIGLLNRLWRDLKLLIPLIRDYWKGKYRDVSGKSLFILVVMLAYIISPIDLIPDYILGLGQIDDVVILGLALNLLEKDLIKYREWRDRDE